jgi:hypothetical protein
VAGVCLLVLLGGCGEKTDLTNEKSPDAPAKTSTAKAGEAGKKPMSPSFQTQQAGNGTSLK